VHKNYVGCITLFSDLYFRKTLPAQALGMGRQQTDYDRQNGKILQRHVPRKTSNEDSNQDNQSGTIPLRPRKTSNKDSNQKNQSGTSTRKTKNVYERPKKFKTFFTFFIHLNQF
jgi:hypothetical protein